FDQQNRGLDITTLRSEAMWHYYLHLMESGPPCPAGELSGLRLYIIVQNAREIGYLALMPSGWRNQLNIVELGMADDGQNVIPPAELILAALDYARKRAESDHHETVGISLPVDHPASVIARHMGKGENQSYGWQMKILDPFRFLEQISPACEERLASSVLRGTSGELNIDLYKQRVGLLITNGRIKARKIDAQADIHLSIPPTNAAQLWLGWKSLKELDDWNKDMWVDDGQRGLIDILFPAASAHIYLGY
ncbi:MAG: hypothetical protein JXA42_05705, partial [Anaerolineales bacterium]|nr:hypothetical protein [Anaerolineales bacterium]